MSLLSRDDPEFIHDLLRRKEFYSLKDDPERNFRDPAEPDPFIGKYLKLQSHQLFARNYFNPNMAPGRLQLTHAPGMGKTAAACAIATEFIRVYKKIYAGLAAKLPPGYRSQVEVAALTPSIVVLGFGGTKAAFERELLGWPEFGFISAAEKEDLARRRLAAASGFEQDIKNYKDFRTHLKKRVTNKSKDGFYRFYGYDEFVNRLFIGQGVKLTDLEADVSQRVRAGESITLEEVFADHIRGGRIVVNQKFMSSLEGSLLICDEIHNTYNMHMKNNRGVAIQYIVDTIKTLWLLTMSATPINNSPTEIVEITNYLSDEKVTKAELFISPRKLAPGALDRLVKLLRGRVSFLQDINPKYFPERIFVGESIPIGHAYESFPLGSSIPYLKFLPCPMSDFFQKTYEKYASERGTTESPEEFSLGENEDAAAEMADLESAATSHTISTDSYCIYDAVFPNPDSDDFGVFKSGEIRSKIAAAPPEWRDKHQIGVKKYSIYNSVLSGEFLSATSVGKFWPKAAELLRRLDGIVSKGEKIMIYHDRVRIPGVLEIQEMLRMNGFLDESMEPVDTTRCVRCGARMGSHGAESEHKFLPARYLTVHSDMDKSAMIGSLAKFNAPENVTGEQFLIIIGSRIIKESYDFKDVQHLFIMSLPTNIPTLIQVLGRCIRRNSHIGLPPEKRQVRVYILLTTAGKGAIDPISPEMYRYMDKILDYMVVQQIEKAVNSHAVDVGLHWNTIMPQTLRDQYFPPGAVEPVAGIGNLYFEPADGIPMYEELNLATFLAYRHFDDEVKTIRYIIKRLFMIQPVYTYSDLLARVRAPPIGVEVNPRLFDERNFIIALHGLVSGSATILSSERREVTESMLVEKLMDPHDRYLYMRGHRYVIVAVGGYYITAPVSEIPANPLDAIHAEYVENIRDRERAMINDLVDGAGTPIVDAEEYLRPRGEEIGGVRVSLAQFVKESKDTSNYILKRRDFVENYTARSFLTGYPPQFQMSFVEECVEKIHRGEKLDEPSSAVMGLLGEFGAIITIGEVAKYRDVGKHFSAGVPTGDADMPIGYIRAKSARIYDVAATQWFEIGRVSLNRHVTYKENDVIIGYLEASVDGMKFKLRKPVQRLRADLAANVASKTEAGAASAKIGIGDIRIVERGAVCSTKSKRDLLKIAGSLGVSVKTIESEKMHKLCQIIFDRVVELEKKERDRGSMYKYFYSWWDEPVNIVGGIRI